MNELLFTSLAIGFFGSLHCVGMCGGLVSALCISRPALWWPGLFSYQFGRISTYILLGLIAGSLGMLAVTSGWFNQAQNVLSYLAGGLMILFACYLGGFFSDPFARMGKQISRLSGLSHWAKKAANSDHLLPWYMAGLLNGLLPCGLVYAGLALSLTAGNSLQGGLIMLTFGLGTLPAMTAVPAIMGKLTPSRRGQVMKLAALLLIILGVFTIFRGTLHGEHNHGNLQNHNPATLQDDMPHENHAHH